MIQDKPTSGLIELTDMSRLRVIAYLQSRGDDDLADALADEIPESPAKEVAAVLTARQSTNDTSVKALAQELRDAASASI